MLEAAAACAVNIACMQEAWSMSLLLFGYLINLQAIVITVSQKLCSLSVI